MGVPSFSDLGDSARNVFKTGYHYGKGLMKFNVRMKSSTNFEMGSDLSLDLDASKLSGWSEVKYKTNEYGIFMERWMADGTLAMGYDSNGKLMETIGLQSELRYNSATDAKSVKIGTKCVNENFNAACAVSSDFNSNTNVFGSIVAAFKDFFVGYQGSYNSETNKMTKNDVGLAFNFNDIAVHFRCTSIPCEYGLSLLYKVNTEWNAAINGILARSGNVQEWTAGAGAKYKIDGRSTVRFKFNTDLQLGMSLQQKLDESVTLTLSCNIDCANVSRGGHKVGLALEIEA